MTNEDLRERLDGFQSQLQEGVERAIAQESYLQNLPLNSQGRVMGIYTYRELYPERFFSEELKTKAVR